MFAPKQQQSAGKHPSQNKSQEKKPFILQRQGLNAGVQAKLKVGQTNDKFEKEADTVADQVVSNSEAPKVDASPTPPIQTQKVGPGDLAQRETEQENEVQMQEEEEVQMETETENEVQTMSDDSESEVQMMEETSSEPEDVQLKTEPEVQAKMEPEPVQKKAEEVPVQKKEVTPELPKPVAAPLIQMKSEVAPEEDVQMKEDEEIADAAENVQLKSKSIDTDEDLSLQINASKGGGAPMERDIKAQMEQGFGHDFSDVRIHTDNNAAELNKSLGARAFTTGNDIFFNEGEFDPDSDKGKHLLAHELTHTVQQGAGAEKVQKKDLFEKRELTPEELEIKTEFNEYVKLVKKSLYSTYTDKKQKKFENNVKKFERKMANGLNKYSEKLKIGTWGSDDYLRLRDKYFLNYKDVIKDEIDRLTAAIKVTIGDVTDSLFDSVTATESFIKEAGSDQGKAAELMSDATVKLEEAVQKRDKAAETLKGFGTDENSAPILAEFDKIIARYQALNKMFAKAFGGIGVDLGEFVKILPELDRNQSLLDNFNSKFASATKLSEFQNLKKIEIPKLMDEIDTLFNKVYDLERKTDAVDEIAYEEEKDQVDLTIEEQEGKVDQIKADEIERRRLAELERKRKEEEERRKAEEEQRRIADKAKTGDKKVTISGKSMLALSPQEFFVVYEQRAQKYLDGYYNRNHSTWKKYKANHSDIFLTGKELADAAKYTYNNAKNKDLKLIAPVEIAVAQAKVEGGVNPGSATERAVINPMNTGVHDGGNDNKKASSLFEIRDEKGWKAARKEGLRYYYQAMYDLWMPDYSTPEKMLEYDHFDNQGNTNYTGRYATAVYYETEVKAEVGHMRMTEDGMLLTKTVGGGSGTAKDKKAVFNYIKSFDKYSGKLKKTKYSDLVEVKGGAPTSSSLSAALRAIQDNEMYPDPSTFSKNKKAVYDGMGWKDKKGSVHARSTGVDGTASKYGPAIGFLYYHYLLSGGSVFNSETKFTVVDETKSTTTTTTKVDATAELNKIKKRYDNDKIGMIGLGKEVVKYCKDYPDEVASFIDSLSYYLDDNIVYRLVKESSKDEVKAWDYDLLKKMEGIMTPQYFRSEGDDERAVYKQLKKAREAKDGAKTKDSKSKPETHSDTYDTIAADTYTVTSDAAWVRDKDEVALNESGKPWKKGEKHKTIPKGITVVAMEEKGENIKVKSGDGKTIYGWTKTSNLKKTLNVDFVSNLTLSKDAPKDIRDWFNTKINKSSIKSRNSSYAKFILRAKELKICTIASEGKGNTASGLSGVEDTFVKIRDGKKIGNSKKNNVKDPNHNFDTTKKEIFILPIIYDLLRKAVVRWDKGGRKGSISEIKLGSFMIWNTSFTAGGKRYYHSELRTSNHGFNGSAIDINMNIDGNDFSKDSALETVNKIIKDLPLINATYEIGLPFQGQFFDIKDKYSGKLKTHTTQVDGVRGGDVMSHLKSTKLKNTIKDKQKKGQKFEFIPDNNNHLHLAVE